MGQNDRWAQDRRPLCDHAASRGPMPVTGAPAPLRGCRATKPAPPQPPPATCPSRALHVTPSALLLTPLPHRNGPSRLQTQKRLGPDRGSLPRDRPRPLPPSFLPQVDAVYATTQAVHAAHRRMGSALKTQEGEQHGGISKKNTTFQPELPSAGLGMNRAAVRLPRRARRWPAACGDHGPGAGDQGPRAGDRGPRAGDHGGVRVAGSSVRRQNSGAAPGPVPTTTGRVPGEGSPGREVSPRCITCLGHTGNVHTAEGKRAAATSVRVFLVWK